MRRVRLPAGHASGQQRDRIQPLEIERLGGSPEPCAAALGADLAGPVDDNFGHLRIAQQILDRRQQVAQRRLAVPHWRT